MSEPSVRELLEHWDGCAGAEATIQDQRDRADRAEAWARRWKTLAKAFREDLRAVILDEVGD